LKNQPKTDTQVTGLHQHCLIWSDAGWNFLPATYRISPHTSASIQRSVPVRDVSCCLQANALIELGRNRIWVISPAKRGCARYLDSRIFHEGGVQGKERPRRPSFESSNGSGAARTRHRLLIHAFSVTQQPFFFVAVFFAAGFMEVGAFLGFFSFLGCGGTKTASASVRKSNSPSRTAFARA
jgi:hypothetical protein